MAQESKIPVVKFTTGIFLCWGAISGFELNFSVETTMMKIVCQEE